MRTFEKSIVAVGVAAFALACSDPMMPTHTPVTGDVAAAVVPHPIDFGGGGTYPANLGDGVLRLCKVANATGSFDFTWSLNGVDQGAIPGGPLVVTTPGTPACRNIYTSTAINGTSFETVVVTEAADQTNWALTGRNVDQYFVASASYPAPRLSDADNTGARSVTVYLTDDLAKLVTFTNTFTDPGGPPPPICDFITFGRLVVEVGGNKVVISGNAGGLNADNSIKGEFHIEANGVDNHVADIDTYGAISSGPLSALTNSRIVTGIAKNGVAVELRLWDGGEPGKGTDRVYVKLNGVELFPNGASPFIDQGNMQYHPNCRGPDDN